METMEEWKEEEMKMPNIKVQPSGNVYEYEVGKTLLEVLLEEGIS